MVEKEYGEEGFCKDASENGAELGKFGCSALHFAKHCRNAKSLEEVEAWCDKNIKVQRWTMLCKNCIGTDIRYSASQKKAVVAFPVESKFV